MQETQSGFQGHARVFLGKLFWQVGGKIVLAGGKIILVTQQSHPLRVSEAREARSFLLPDLSPPDDPI